MAYTYEAIATVTAGSGGTSSITFSNIPQTFTDLTILFSIRNNGNNAGGFLRFNSDTGSNYIYRRLTSGWNTQSSDGNDAASSIFVNIDPATATGNTFSSAWIYIGNYTSSSTKRLTIDSVLESNATSFGGGAMMFSAAQWTGTSAITSISFVSEDAGQNLSQYSTATLYGIKNS